MIKAQTKWVWNAWRSHTFNPTGNDSPTGEIKSEHFFHITLISFWNNYYASWCPFRVTKRRHHGWRTGNEDAPLRLRLFHVCARFQRSKVAPQGSRIQPSAALSRLAGSLVLTDSVCGIHQWWCWQKVASVEHQMQQPSCQVLPTIQHVWETHMLQRAHALVGS